MTPQELQELKVAIAAAKQMQEQQLKVVETLDKMIITNLGRAYQLGPFLQTTFAPVWNILEPHLTAEKLASEKDTLQAVHSKLKALGEQTFADDAAVKQAQKELEEARQALTTSQEQLSAGQAQLFTERVELEGRETVLTEGEKKLKKAQSEHSALVSRDKQTLEATKQALKQVRDSTTRPGPSLQRDTEEAGLSSISDVDRHKKIVIKIGSSPVPTSENTTSDDEVPAPRQSWPPRTRPQAAGSEADVESSADERASYSDMAFRNRHRDDGPPRLRAPNYDQSSNRRSQTSRPQSLGFGGRFSRNNRPSVLHGQTFQHPNPLAVQTPANTEMVVTRPLQFGSMPTFLTRPVTLHGHPLQQQAPTNTQMVTQPQQAPMNPQLSQAPANTQMAIQPQQTATNIQTPTQNPPGLTAQTALATTQSTVLASTAHPSAYSRPDRTQVPPRQTRYQRRLHERGNFGRGDNTKVSQYGDEAERVMADFGFLGWGGREAEIFEAWEVVVCRYLAGSRSRTLEVMVSSWLGINCALSGFTGGGGLTLPSTDRCCKACTQGGVGYSSLCSKIRLKNNAVPEERAFKYIVEPQCSS